MVNDRLRTQNYVFTHFLKLNWIVHVYGALKIYTQNEVKLQIYYSIK